MDLIKANMNTNSSQQWKQDDKHLPVDVPVDVPVVASKRGPTSTTSTRTSTPSSSFCCSSSSVFII